MKVAFQGISISATLSVRISYNIHDKRAGQISARDKNPSSYIITIRSINSQPNNIPQANKEAHIIMALQAYQADPKLSLQQAAKIYNIHFQTLHYRSQGRQARDNYIPSSRKLSNQEEQVIIEYILNLDSQGFASRHRNIKEIANQLLANRDT